MPEFLIAPRLGTFVTFPSQIWLVSAPAIDTRFPWAPWHQPTGLLQIGAVLQKQGCGVRLIDCLQPDQSKRITRRKVNAVQIEGYELDLSHYGMPWNEVAKQVRAFKEEGWIPDMVFVSCFNTSWWQGTQELIRHLKEELPDAQVILGGVYPSLEPEHAATHSGADTIVVGSIPEACTEVPQLELYGEDRIPRFAGVYLYQSRSVADSDNTSVVARSSDDIANEIAHKAGLGVTEFAFFDEEIRLDQRDHFLKTLDAITKRDLDIRFVAVGNVSPSLIDGTVAHKMGQVGYRQVFLKCDVTHRPDGTSYDTSYEVYQDCTAALHREAKLKPRSDQLTAMLLVGNPYEDIEVVTERLIRLASIVGSVNLVQYQHNAGTPDGRMYEALLSQDDGHRDLTMLNCKFYPLARRTGVPYENYLELTRLATLLNSKHRSRTFDFLGTSLVVKAIQTSLRERVWDPFRSDSAV